jgi:hypothetical protein
MSKKPHPIPTFFDRHGRECDEFGPLNVEQDTFALRLSDMSLEFKNGVKSAKNELKHAIEPSTRELAATTWSEVKRIIRSI